LTPPLHNNPPSMIGTMDDYDDDGRDYDGVHDVWDETGTSHHLESPPGRLTTLQVMPQMLNAGPTGVERVHFPPPENTTVCFRASQQLGNEDRFHNNMTEQIVVQTAPKLLLLAHHCKNQELTLRESHGPWCVPPDPERFHD
jgi:hypothetical protein